VPPGSHLGRWPVRVIRPARAQRALEYYATKDRAMAAEAHVDDWLSARERATIPDALGRRLAYEPTVETGNRKRLRPNPLAPWELRIGYLPVYFDVEEEP
jgi:hypothetical protein